MCNQFSRLESLIGEEKLNLLKSKRVAVFGLGGVGGSVCEALARSAISHFDLFDGDVVSLTNLNRQVIALMDTIDKDKVEVTKERILKINPAATINTHKVFFLEENSGAYDFSQYDYVIDAVDTVSAKIEIIRKAKEANTLVISSMGTGNKMNPTMLEVSDINKTSVCPLAKVMRYELRKRNIKNVKVVFSKEEPLKLLKENSDTKGKKMVGSSAFVPPVAGYIIASEVVKDFLKD